MRYRVTLFVFPPESTSTSWEYDVTIRLAKPPKKTRDLCRIATAKALQFLCDTLGPAWAIDANIIPAVSIEGGHITAQELHRFGRTD